MRRKKVVFVMGTRPEVIKLAPVIAALRAHNGVSIILVGTAQHRGLMDSMLKTFGLALDVDLDLMLPGQSPQDLLSRALPKLISLYKEEKPDLVVVQGDTTSALAGAIAARQACRPLAHIEAGLRSGDLAQPFPEEIHRVAIDRWACLHFAPTHANRKNLLREGVCAKGIHVTGNTGVDSLSAILSVSTPWENEKLKELLAECGGDPKILLTVHRRENFGTTLREIFLSVRELIRRNIDLQVFYPVHPNPHIRRACSKYMQSKRIHLLRPLSYSDFLGLASRMSVILTDSGGVQEEAPTLDVPVVLLRNVTDRPEALRGGRVALVGAKRENIVKHTTRYLKADSPRRKIIHRHPFGDGKAAPRIVRKIIAFCAENHT